MGGGGRRKAEWSYVVREAEVRRVSWGDITRAGTETKMRLRYATSLFKGRTALKPLAQMGQTVTPRDPGPKVQKKWNCRHSLPQFIHGSKRGFVCTLCAHVFVAGERQKIGRPEQLQAKTKRFLISSN